MKKCLSLFLALCLAVFFGNGFGHAWTVQTIDCDNTVLVNIWCSNSRIHGDITTLGMTAEIEFFP